MSILLVFLPFHWNFYWKWQFNGIYIKSKYNLELSSQYVEIISHKFQKFGLSVVESRQYIILIIFCFSEKLGRLNISVQLFLKIIHIVGKFFIIWRVKMGNKLYIYCVPIKKNM